MTKDNRTNLEKIQDNLQMHVELTGKNPTSVFIQANFFNELRSQLGTDYRKAAEPMYVFGIRIHVQEDLGPMGKKGFIFEGQTFG